MRRFYHKYRAEFILIRDSVIGWELALIFWTLVRNVGVKLQGVAKLTALENLEIILIFGPAAGILFGLAQIQLEKVWYGKVPLWRLALRGVFSTTVIMTFIILCGYLFFKEVIGFDTEVTLWEFLQIPNTIMTYFYSILVASVLATIRQLNLVLGKGNLLRLIKGDFYMPRVELRLFMFIDLEGSTSLAEELGHLKYSRYIQDCFKDLSVVAPYEAEIYQYVGDEVVLTWKITPNTDYSKCVEAFWSYEDQLLSRKDYYLETYGSKPKFKAGLHLGEVTTAEVGDIKREIAYHGDTINITARIQERCKSMDTSLLISEQLLNRLHLNGHIQAEFMAEEKLRGKKKPVKLFSLKRLS